MFGIACVCTSLIALVASIARQARGSYTMGERRRWMSLVLCMGGLAFVLGLILIFTFRGESINFVGFVLIGLALICWSISSKVILLAKIWHADFPLANRIRSFRYSRRWRAFSSPRSSTKRRCSKPNTSFRRAY